MDKLKARQTHSRSASISDPTVTGRSGEGTDWSVVGHHEALEYEDQESQDLHVQFGTSYISERIETEAVLC